MKKLKNVTLMELRNIKDYTLYSLKKNSTVKTVQNMNKKSYFIDNSICVVYEIDKRSNFIKEVTILSKNIIIVEFFENSTIYIY